MWRRRKGQRNFQKPLQHCLERKYMQKKIQLLLLSWLEYSYSLKPTSRLVEDTIELLALVPDRTGLGSRALRCNGE